MHTTFYRSLVLLVSIFALTSSFSLSSGKNYVWVFEYTDNNLEDVKRLEDGLSVATNDISFISEVKSNLAHLSLKEEQLHYAFRIYKKGKKEQQIIGLIFRTEESKKIKLMLHKLSNDKFTRLETHYPKDIEERTVDLTKKPIFQCVSYEKNAYVFRIDWEAPYKMYNGKRYMISMV